MAELFDDTDQLLTMPALYAVQSVGKGRVSVRLSHRSTAADMGGGSAAERPVFARFRSKTWGAGAAYQLQRRRAAGAALSSKCGQCHVYSRRRHCFSHRTLHHRPTAVDCNF